MNVLKYVADSIKYVCKKCKRTLKRKLNRFRKKEERPEKEAPFLAVLTIDYAPPPCEKDEVVYGNVVCDSAADLRFSQAQVRISRQCQILLKDDTHGPKIAICQVFPSSVQPPAIFAKAVIDPIYFPFFKGNASDPDEILHQLHQFRQMDTQEQNIILSMATVQDQKAPETSPTVQPIIRDLPALDMLFDILQKKELLPPNVITRLSELRQQIGAVKQRPETLTAYRTLLNIWANNIAAITTPTVPAYDELLASLESVHDGDRPTLEAIARMIRLHSRSSESGFAMLFLGPPGTGKTSLARALAQVISRVHHEIPCRGLTSTDLLGIATTYEGSAPGKITSAILTAGRGVLVLDEFDKFDIRDSSPYLAFDSVFDDRKTFFDSSLECEIPMQDTIIIMCCNELDSIPQSILDRLQGRIFVFGCQEEQRKIEILTRFVLPRLLNSYQFQPSDIAFGEDAIGTLLRVGSLRGMSHLATHVLAAANVLIEAGEPTPIYIGKEFVEKNLPASITSNTTRRAGF